MLASSIPATNATVSPQSVPQQLTDDHGLAENTTYLPESVRESLYELLDASVAPNTRKAYMSRWRLFSTWARTNGFQPLPAEPAVLASYIAEMSGQKRSVSTVEQSLAAISAVHKAKGYESPTSNLIVQKTLKGYSRLHGVAPHKKSAATLDVVKLMLQTANEQVRYGELSRFAHARNCAIITLGFAGAFRRSELSALTVDDLEWQNHNDKEILIVHLKRSKTDQTGKGLDKAIFPSENPEICPIVLLKRWLSLARINSGPVFRRLKKNGSVTKDTLSDRSIAEIVKRMAGDAGLNLDISGHSLRRGFVTTAIRAGRSERSIMHQTGHKSASTLREYFERESVIEDNAADGLMN